MTDELDRLSGLKAPAASTDARARALALSLQAFDEAEKNSATPQGSQNGWRQSSIINRIWSPIMNKKFLAGSALATLLVVPAAAFLTFELTRGGLPVATPDVEIASGELQTAKDKDATAAKEDVRQQQTAAGTEKKVEAKPEPKSEAVEDALRAEPVVREDDSTKSSSNAGEQKTAVADQKTADSEGRAGPQTAETEAAVAADEAVEPAASVDAQQNEMAEIDTTVPMKSLTRSRQVEMFAGQPSPAILPNEAFLQQDDDRDRFSAAETNPVKSVLTDPVSTFSADVDTASYSFVRKALLGGQLPDKDSVRVEEMINYFPYDWAGPASDAEPFKATVTLLPTPWNANTRLMHVGIKGYDVVQAAQPRANLVFLIDVSGSMDEPEKLPLLKGAFRLLVEKLKPEDTVSIVTYAGNAGTVLTPTKVSDKAKILSAIDTLEPGGSTAGAQGIEAAYALAQSAFVKDGVNRVMLATDGDFNVGPSSDDELKTMIEAKRKSGIFLSVLGFGRGNYNDALMQTLAQNGNGTAAYIDTLAEAQKSLVEEAGSSLFPIAKDVKFQVEFNPAQIAEYRLIGYETRALKREDFNNDKVDAGDIGSGHRVTAIYEVTPKGSPAVLNDALRYETAKGPVTETATPAGAGELAFLKIRYKKPDSDTSTLITTPVTEANAVANLDAASTDVRFSVAVAAFGQKLRGTDAVSNYAYGSILGLATGARGEDAYGYRSEFLNLVRLAKGLSGE
ncbi:vWA domain-containing protein [Pararhizobium sp.]|uniref:vWA domain-containing protein n=1 Tax=Pararhizobium sp. TaxID=1977563 RepID=UPI0027287607|nr:VWA domain-containing protein [Pararhizobium sp.]MDO9418713.1 VWA domain-containing protein [Pararhizobium sp.]